LSKDWPAVHVPPIFHIFGITFIIIGLAGLFYGMIRLGIFRSVGRGAKKLQRTGIYGRTRNPQALACGGYVVGFSMLWPSWQALAWAMLYFVLIHMMIITEEEHLLHIYNQEYMEYCQAVPRYLGLNSFLA
jgi:protein-S-isoprenylcysteine O-methyltransferase Ste14